MDFKKRIRQAVLWNIASAPIRVSLGILQTAVLARTLTQSGTSPLSHFAFITSFVLSAVLISSAGMPQVFSKIAAGRIAVGDNQTALSFLVATAILRTIAWIFISSIMMALVLVLPGVFPDGIGSALIEGQLLYLTLMWGWCYDLAGLTGRLLSAGFEQKGQNIINLFSQIASIGIISIGLVFRQYALELAVAGMFIMQLCQMLGHLVILLRKSIGLKDFNPMLGFVLWRNEARQTLHLSADKFASYMLSPSLLILLAGKFFSGDIVTNVFLLFDFSAKINAALAIPLGGLVLPILGRAKEFGQAKLKSDVTFCFGVSSLLAFCVAITIGALGIPVGRVLYGEVFNVDALILNLIVGGMVAEYMVFELVSAYLTVQNRSSRLWRLKLVVGFASILVAALVFFVEPDSRFVIVALFMVRFMALPLFVFVCDAGFRNAFLALVALTGLLVAIAMSEHFYNASQAGLGKILHAVFGGFCIMVFISVTIFKDVLRDVRKRLFV